MRISVYFSFTFLDDKSIRFINKNKYELKTYFMTSVVVIIKIVGTRNFLF